MKTKLTETNVDALKTTEKRYRVFDAETKGLCVEVLPSGSKRWQVEYRPHPGGRGVAKKRMALGAAHALTPDQARKAAQAILAEVAKGADPARARTEKRREKRIADLIEIYEAEGGTILRGVRIGQPMKPRNKQWMLNRLRHHVLPLLGSRRVSEVTPTDIESMARDIGAGRTAKDEKVGPRRRIIAALVSACQMLAQSSRSGLLGLVENQ